MNVNESNFCVVIGGANMDILGSPDSALLPKTSTPGIVSYSAGGVARNIAENLARLGNNCYLIAPVGNDQQGKRLIELSTKAGINTSRMVRLNGHLTSCYMSITDVQGEMQSAIADMEIFQHFNSEHLQKHLILLQKAQFIVLDTNLNHKLLTYLFKNLPDTKFFVDTVSVIKSTKINPFLSSIHTLKPNLVEAEYLSGIKVKNDADLSILADWFHKQGVEYLFITMGSRGLYYSDGQNNDLVSLPISAIVNSNGAGDALMAALAHCWQNKIETRECSYFALAAARLTLASTNTVSHEMSVFAVEKILDDM